MFQPELRDCTGAPLLQFKVAILEPEPWECALRSCGNALRVLPLHPKLAILQPELRQHSTIFLYLRIAILEPKSWECTSRATFVLKTCESRAKAAGALFVYYFPWTSKGLFRNGRLSKSHLWQEYMFSLVPKSHFWIPMLANK